MQPFECLLEAAFLPAAPDAFQDRPQSPDRLAASAGAPDGQISMPGSLHPWAGGKPASTAPVPGATPAVNLVGYVPPHLRGGGGVPGAGGGGRPAPQFSLAYDAADRPGKIVDGRTTTSAKPQAPPGAHAPPPGRGHGWAVGSGAGRARQLAAGSSCLCLPRLLPRN